MSDAAPIPILSFEPPRRDRRIVVTAAISVAVHVLVLALVLLPRSPTTTPTEPKSIAVDLVPPSEVSSLEPSVSSEAPSSEASSSAASSSSPPSSAEPVSSAEPPSSAAASSQEPSSAEPASSAAASEPPPSSAPEAPRVPPARPVVIPVGPSEASSEELSSVEDSSASEEASTGSAASSTEASSAPEASSEEVLTASGADAGEGVEQGTAASPASEEPDDAGSSPPQPGALRAAKRFYLASMLSAPNMARMREALKALPREKRLAQTCNIEAIAQIGNAGRGFQPDALVANAFAAPAATGNSYSAGNAAFRSEQKWYNVAYDCTLNKDLSAVASFSLRIGSDVTGAMQARLGR